MRRITTCGRGWRPRTASKPNKEPSTYELPFFENSVSGQDPVCVPSAAPDFYSSNKLTQATISKYGKPS